MSHRRLWAAVAVLLASSLAAAGCSSGSSTPSTSASGSASNPTGTLTFVADKTWDFKAYSKVSQADIGISLNPTIYADQNAFVAFVKQSFRTNKAPGLFTWHTGGQLEELVNQNLVSDTTGIWDAAVAAGDVAPSVRDLYTVNGKQYCTPISVDDWVMYYDKKTFAQYGIKPPTTWAEMLAAADTLKANGIAPFWSRSGNPWAFVWFQILLAGTDLQLYKDLSTGKASYTDPRVVAVMNTWLDMQQKGYFSDPGSKTEPEELMKNKKLGMLPFGTWYASTMETAGLKSGTDWGVFAIPAVNPQSPTTPVAIETAPACVTEKSTQKDLGLAYSKWWMSADAQTAWSKQEGNLPFNPKAKASTQTFQDIGQQLADTKKYETYLRYYEATPTPVLTVALDEFSGFMTNPGDPMKYLQAIQDKSASYWASR